MTNLQSATPLRRRRRRRRGDSRSRPALPAPGSVWGRFTLLGKDRGSARIRIQSRKGYRALSMEIEPGIWIVTELVDSPELLEQPKTGAASPAQQVAKDVLKVVDQALDTIFPARAERKRLDRDRKRQEKETARLRKEAEKARRDAAKQRALQPPVSPVTKKVAPWARNMDVDADYELVEDDETGCNGRCSCR